MSQAAGRGRRNLVVVRAGRKSLHPRWLGADAERSYDLIVSAFEPGVPQVEGDGIVHLLQPGGKWDGLHATFAARGLSGDELVRRYDHVWLPDDDIDTTPAAIEHMFEAMTRYGLNVGQPSLTRNSYYSHFLLLNCPGFRVRFTNYVEIMVPCLRSAVLARVLPDFAGNMSGYGLDYVWCRLSEQPKGTAGVIDEIAMHHTRPVGGALKQRMASLGRASEAEEAELKRRYGIDGRTVPVAYAGIDANGDPIEGRIRMATRMGRAYLAARDYPSRDTALRDLIKITRRQFTKRLDLTAIVLCGPRFAEARPRD